MSKNFSFLLICTLIGCNQEQSGSSEVESQQTTKKNVVKVINYSGGGIEGVQTFYNKKEIDYSSTMNAYEVKYFNCSGFPCSVKIKGIVKPVVVSKSGFCVTVETPHLATAAKCSK